jgi:hypothetical protein
MAPLVRVPIVIPHRVLSLGAAFALDAALQVIR